MSAAANKRRPAPANENTPTPATADRRRRRAASAAKRRTRTADPSALDMELVGLMRRLADESPGRFRELAASIAENTVDQLVAKWSADPAPDTGLDRLDVELAGWCALAEHRVSSDGAMAELLGLPVADRRHICELIADVMDDPTDPAKAVAELRGAIMTRGGSASTGDAFTMPTRAWDRAHVAGMLVRQRGEMRNLVDRLELVADLSPDAFRAITTLIENSADTAVRTASKVALAAREHAPRSVPVAARSSTLLEEGLRGIRAMVKSGRPPDEIIAAINEHLAPLPGWQARKLHEIAEGDPVLELAERQIFRGDAMDTIRLEIFGSLSFDGWPADAIRGLMGALMRVAPEDDRAWISEVARAELKLLAELDGGTP